MKQISSVFSVTENDLFLSFLPFSHTFERTVAHYVSVAHGSAMAFARSVANIENDLLDVKPTLMCSVPRVYERIYQKLQLDLSKRSEEKRRLFDWALEVGWRRFCRENDLPVVESERSGLDDTVAKMLDDEVGDEVRALFGGRLRATFAGGASLNHTVAKFFCAMGVSVQQVYGLTETSPIVSFTTALKNHPHCVGFPVPGTEVRIGENDELQVRGPQVMQGYWGKPAETRAAFTEDGWFRTGDQADLSDGGRVRIKGRIKEIIVTSTGEKVPPSDLEAAIETDRLFAQTMVVGDDKPYIAALAVVHPDAFKELCDELGLDPEDDASLDAKPVRQAALKRIKLATSGFPNYGVPRQVKLLRDAWTIDNGLLTPTLKLKRNIIRQRYVDEIDALYDLVAK